MVSGAEPDVDRVFIAGLILEAVLDTPGLGPEPSGRRNRVKNRVRRALLTHLAGWVTLQRFRELAVQLDHWFPIYYPLVAVSRNAVQSGMEIYEASPGAGPSPVLREDLLDQLLHRHPQLLPRRRHRKLYRRGLLEFLHRTRGGAFRLKDFQEFFQIDRKTAWEYVQKLRLAGLLEHNQGRSAAVRYSLNSRFLAG
ncbi:MAG: hypothetical protein FJ126_02990 [Deltaproteobacteria bacterium]|nr:hypothetical protein [Deltaproteobacteria bacterium]